MYCQQQHCTLDKNNILWKRPKVRPPGTFSVVKGVVSYTKLVKRHPYYFVLDNSI